MTRTWALSSGAAPFETDEMSAEPKADDVVVLNLMWRPGFLGDTGCGARRRPSSRRFAPIAMCALSYSTQRVACSPPVWIVSASAIELRSDQTMVYRVNSGEEPRRSSGPTQAGYISLSTQTPSCTSSFSQLSAQPEPRSARRRHGRRCPSRFTFPLAHHRVPGCGDGYRAV